MATVRGQPEDYDAWESAGLPGWGWSDVAKYFMAAENDLDFGASPIHGSDGPLTLSRWMPEEQNRYQSAFAAGLREVGVPEMQDINDPTQLPGIAVFPATLDAKRQRLTTSSAYLTPAERSRENLEIRGKTPVSRVNFDGDRAIGVTLATGEELAADEVIVAAGAIGSPALLLRSGVGPRDQLSNRGIAVHADLPVGSTMSDHLGPAMLYDYDGPVANTGGPSQPVLVGASDGKNVDYHVFPAPALDLDSNSFTLLTYVLRSSGLGSVEFGDDVDGPLVVTAPPLPPDAESLLRHAFDVIAAWEKSSAAKRINCRPADPHDLSAPSAVADALDKFTMSYGHMVGTCPMGSVLDAECRVRGMSGLRVVDASAMPRIPVGNTYLGCVMVAERVAELMIDAASRVRQRSP